MSEGTQVDPSKEIEKYLQMDINILEDSLRKKLTETFSNFTGNVYPFVRDGLRKQLCDDWKLCEKLRNGTIDLGKNGAILISREIETFGNWETFALIIAAYLTKRGLENFCDCNQIR